MKLYGKVVVKKMYVSSLSQLKSMKFHSARHLMTLWMPVVGGMHQYCGMELYTAIYVQVCERCY